jgi:hypothetical protein
MQVFEKEFDALTGVTTIYGIEDGKFIVKSVQNITPHLEQNKAKRDDPDFTKRMIKANILPAVSIPDAVCLKMRREDGFDPYTASAKDLRLFLRKNRDKYSYLFTTEARI